MADGNKQIAEEQIQALSAQLPAPLRSAFESAVRFAEGTSIQTTDETELQNFEISPEMLAALKAQSKWPIGLSCADVGIGKVSKSDLEEALDLKFRQTPNKVRALFASKRPDDRDKATAALAKLALEAIREQEERDARTERPAAPSVGGWVKE